MLQRSLTQDGFILCDNDALHLRFSFIYICLSKSFTMKIFISCLVVVFLFASCSSTKKIKATKTTHTVSDINELVKIMSGTFSSAQQAKKDSDYFNISLVMVPIWAQ